MRGVTHDVIAELHHALGALIQVIMLIIGHLYKQNTDKQFQGEPGV